MLINTAKLFGINEYKIVWSDLPVSYGYTDPGLFYCMRQGIAPYYGVQVIPSSEVKTVVPSSRRIDELNMKHYDYICYRPIVDNDSIDYIEANYDDTEGAIKYDGKVVMAIEDVVEPHNGSADSHYEFELFSLNLDNSFEFSNWYLIPTENGAEKLEIAPANYNTTIQPTKEIKHWISNEDLTSGEVALTRDEFKSFTNTAEQLNINKFKIVYNNQSSNPIYYGFLADGVASAELRNQVALQVIPTGEIGRLVDVSVREEYWYTRKLFYWTLIENYAGYTGTEKTKYYVFHWSGLDQYKQYYMIPIDDNGNEVYKLYIS